MNLTTHFTLREFTRSSYAIRKGINNEPNDAQIENLRTLCALVLEPLRMLVDSPITILSGYRCPEVNVGIGGSKTSQHMEGKAADIMVPEWPPEALYELMRNNMHFDQLIQEFDEWVHVSWNGVHNRQQSLRFTRSGSGELHTIDIRPLKEANA